MEGSSIMSMNVNNENQGFPYVGTGVAGVVGAAAAGGGTYLYNSSRVNALLEKPDEFIKSDATDAQKRLVDKYFINDINEGIKQEEQALKSLLNNEGVVKELTEAEIEKLSDTQKKLYESHKGATKDSIEDFLKTRAEERKTLNTSSIKKLMKIDIDKMTQEEADKIAKDLNKLLEIGEEKPTLQEMKNIVEERQGMVKKFRQGAVNDIKNSKLGAFGKENKATMEKTAGVLKRSHVIPAALIGAAVAGGLYVGCHYYMRDNQSNKA